jgi:hypothetical protein
MDALDRSWDGAAGFNLVFVSDVTQANIIIHDAPDSASGGFADGVLGSAELAYSPVSGVTDLGRPYLEITGQVIVTMIQGWNWYTDGPDAGTTIGSSQYDYQTVVTHELGHAVGLFHDSNTYGNLNGDGYSVMLPYLNAGQVRQNFSPADIKWLDHLYVGLPNPGSIGDPAIADGLHAGDFVPTSASLPGGALVSVATSASEVLGGGQGETVTVASIHPSDSATLVGLLVQSDQPAFQIPASGATLGRGAGWVDSASTSGKAVEADAITPAAPATTTIHAVSSASMSIGDDNVTPNAMPAAGDDEGPVAMPPANDTESIFNGPVAPRPAEGAFYLRAEAELDRVARTFYFANYGATGSSADYLTSDSLGLDEIDLSPDRAVQTVGFALLLSAGWGRRRRKESPSGAQFDLSTFARPVQRETW